MKTSKKVTPLPLENDDRFHLVIKDLTDGIILVNNQGIVTECNPRLEEITGYTRKETLGSYIWDIIYNLYPAPDKSNVLLEQINAAFLEAFETGNLPDVWQPSEQTIQKADGTLLSVRLISYLLKVSNGYSMVILVQNLTGQEQLENSLRQSVEELSSLHEISLEIVSHHDLPTVVQKIVEKAILLLRADGGYLYLCDEEKKQIFPYVESHAHLSKYKGKAFKYGEGAVGKVAQTGKSLIINDYNSWEGRSGALDPEQPYNAILSVPLLWKGRITGVLQVLADGERRVFNNSDEELLILFASQAMIAIENARLLDVERTYRKDAESISRAAYSVTSSLHLDEVLEEILSQLENVVPYDSASVMLLEAEQLRAVAVRSLPYPDEVLGHTFPADNLLFQKIRTSGKALILEDAQAHSEFQGWGGTGDIHGWMGLPLTIRGEVIGYITLDSRMPAAYQSSQAQLAESFANQAAIAIENARLFEAERVAREQEESVRQVAQAVSASLDLDEVIRRILEQLKRVLIFDTTSVVLLDKNGRPELIAGIGYQDEHLTSQKANELLVDSPILKQMAIDLQTIVIPEVKEHPGWIWVPGAEHVHSFLGVPLVARQKLIGVLMVDNTEVDFFHEAEVNRVSILAQQLAIAVENARLFEAERSQLLLAKTLQEVGALLTSKSGLDEVLECILDLLGRVVSYDSASIQLLKGDGSLEVAAWRGFPDEETAYKLTQSWISGHSQQKWSQTHVTVIKDTHSDEHWKVLPGTEHIRSWIGAPLLVKGQYIGSLNIDSRKVNAYNESIAQTVMAFANQAAIAIENARLFEVERKSRESAEALGDAARVLGSTLSLNQVVEAMLEQLARVLPFDSGNVMFVENDHLVIKGWRGYESFSENLSVEDIRFDLTTDNIAANVMRTGEPMVLAGVNANPNWQSTAMSQHIRSWLGVPLKVRDEVIGLLNLDRCTLDGFSEEEVKLAQTFALHASTALANARVFENEGKRVNELEVLRKASLSLTASLELEEVFNAILRSTLTLLPSANNSHIFLCLGDSRETLKFGAALWADGRKGEPFAIPRSDGLTATVAKRGEMLVVPDMRKHSLFQNTPEDWKGAIVGIPLKIGQRVVGVMNISYLTPREFSDSELRLLGLLGDQAAIAIENARLYEQAARERRHLGLLFDISRELGFSFEPDEILSRAVSLTSTAFNALLGQAFAYQPDTNFLSLRALHGKTKLTVDEYNRLVKIKMGDGLAGWVAQSRQPLYVGDVLQEDRWLHVPALDENVRSAISAPILAEEKILGVITIMDDHTFAFSDDHLELLQTICHQVGLALSNAARYQEMKRRLAEITLIQNLAQTFTRRLELQELLDEVVSQLAQLLGYPMVEIYLVEGDLMHLRSFSGDIQPPPAIPVTRGVVGRVARSGISALIDNVSLDPDYCADNPATECELAVPIFRGDIVIGVINIETNEIAKFDQQDLILLQVLAGQISIAYENAVLYDQMRQHADDLERDVTRRTAELAELFELSQRIGYIFSYEDLFRVLLNHLYNATGGNFVSGCLWQDNVDSPTLYTLHPLEPSDQEKLLSYLHQKVELEVAGELPIRFNQIVVQPSVKNINVSPITSIENYRHVPIQVGQRKVGILVVGETITSLSEDGERLLRTFANQAAGAIERVEAIRAAEKKRLESLVEYLPNGVLLLDAEKRILVINPMAQEILTSLNNEGKDGKLTQLAQFTMDELVNLSNGSVPVEINTNGQISKAYEVLAQKVGDQNNQYIIAIRDVTQEREIQTRIQMQDRLATVGQLAAGIAHDFNNIMAAILVYADLLRDDATLSTSSKDRLAIIQQQVQRASSLIRQILDFSRRSVMEQSALNLLPFIKELEKMLHRVLPETIHLELTYKPGDYVVNADPTRLQQVFMNLALNARDAMPEGGLLHFEIDQYCLEPEDIAPLHYLPPGKWIRILIRDTGAGIPGEYLPHIFEPFFTTKPAGVGTGLGLAQVYGIIKQHEGYIDVKSKAGEGTVFTIYLPALETPKSDKISMDKTAQLDGEGQTVMVVEDDRATLEALCTLLEAHNYQVLTARNGREALECYTRDQSTISMVVSDVVMPEMGGVELYHQLKQRWGDIRMLFVTGHPMSGESQKLLEKGNVHWLQKPFSVKEFSQAVQSLFRA